MIAGLLLAAGASRRFGTDKLLASLDGRPVLRWSAAALQRATDLLYVVMPPDASAYAAALRDVPHHPVPHAGRAEGMGSSLRAGIVALRGEQTPVDAVVVALADQPTVDPAVIAALVARWRAGGAAAVAPRYRDGRGHPVLFDRGCFDRLAALAGDRGARAVLDSLGDALALVAVEGDAPPDVDTPEVLAALARSAASAG